MNNVKKNDKIQNQKKKFLRDILFLLIVVIISLIFLQIFPEKQKIMINTSKKFFLEMIIIFPAIMVLIGLFAVFVPNELIVKYLGKSSGIKGILLALLIGALPTGPLYIAFPMASALIKKGARISNIIIFLSAWACIKVPQELVELQFLGFKFMILRLILTIIFVIIMGIIIEKMNSKIGYSS